MGREVKRVPLDFAWPMRQTWKGYVNPYRSITCKACGGNGFSPEYKKLENEWYSLDKAEWVFIGNGCRYNKLAWQYNLDSDDIAALLEADRLWDFTRVPLNDEHKKIISERIATGQHNSWLPFNNGYIPTPKEVNEWATHGFGHDSINCYICCKAKAKRLGLNILCESCKGEGKFWQTEEIKLAHDNWENFEPPAGEGWQMWETTSEGSPMSPVCNTPEELARWLVDNSASSFGSETATYEQWLAMIGEGWAMSGVLVDGKVLSGVAACKKG